MGVQRWKVILFGEPLRSMSGGTLGTGLSPGREKDSGAHLKYLKDPPRDSKYMCWAHTQAEQGRQLTPMLRNVDSRTKLT